MAGYSEIAPFCLPIGRLSPDSEIVSHLVICPLGLADKRTYNLFYILLLEVYMS